jgi:membrane protease YdiL (CAAX protease family)
MQFTNWVRRSPLIAYFVLVFAIEWLLVFILSPFVPPVLALLAGSWLPNGVGLLVIGVAGGRAGLRQALGRATRWRFDIKWYVIPLLAPIGTALLVIGLNVLMGRGTPAFAPAGHLLPILLAALFTGALGEELGWRGVGLPGLQSLWNPLASSLILGLLWGLYHLPAFFLSGLSQQNLPLLPFIAAAIGISVLVSWTYNRTGGSLIPVFLCHFSFNFVGNATGIFGNPSLFGLWAAICSAVAMGVVALDWGLFTRPAVSVPADGIWTTRP